LIAGQSAAVKQSASVSKKPNANSFNGKINGGFDVPNILAPNFNAPCAAKKPNRKLVADATSAIKIASTKIARISAPRVNPTARIVPNCQRRDRTEFATAPITAIDAIISVVIGVLLSPQITESARLEIDCVKELRVDNLT
jgi:hypothetical protein